MVWFTGLSGAGKSTIANLVEKKLFAQGRHTYLLDGDNVRRGLNRERGAFAQTALRCRAMQVASTSSAGRCHQSREEKISTSL